MHLASNSVSSPVVGPTNHPQRLDCSFSNREMPLALLIAGYASPSGIMPACAGCIDAVPTCAGFVPCMPACAGFLRCGRDAPCSWGCLSGHAGIQGLPVPQTPFYDASRSARSHAQGEHAFKIFRRCHTPLIIPASGSWKGAKYFLSRGWAKIPLFLGLLEWEIPRSQEFWKPSHPAWQHIPAFLTFWRSVARPLASPLPGVRFAAVICGSLHLTSSSFWHLDRKSAMVLSYPGLCIAMNLYACNAKAQRVMWVLSF